MTASGSDASLARAPSRGRRAESRRGDVAAIAVFALALSLAFLPVIRDLVGHWWAQPWSRYSALFLPLLLRAVASEPAAPRALREGFAWILLGLAIEIVAVGGGVVRLGRPGLAFAVIGALRSFGLAQRPTALLALACVPVPHIALGAARELYGEALLRALLPLADAAGALLGGDASAPLRLADAGLRALAGRAGLELVAASGLPLAALLAGLGWYAALRSGPRTLGAAAGRALRWALWAVPLQLAILFSSLTLLGAGAATAAALLWHHLGWLGVATLGVVHAERGARRGGESPS